MKSFKVLIQIMMIAAVAASVTACSKKSEKSSVRRTQARNYNAGTSAPGSNPQAQGSVWGEVTGFADQELVAFLGDSDFGDVSPLANQATGIRFFGKIDVRGQGYLNMYVYDTLSDVKGPIELKFTCSGVVRGNETTMTCQEERGGDLILVGVDYGNEHKGSVFFNNRSNSLGQFRISACGFFTC